MYDILDLDMSHCTINYALRETGFKPGRKVKKSALTPDHKEERLHFAQVYEDWIESDWKCVIFSDETTFQHFRSN